MDFDKIAIQYKKTGAVDGAALVRLRPLMLAMIKRYYPSFRERDDLLQELCIVTLEAFMDFDEAMGVHVLALVKSRIKYWLLNKYKDGWKGVMTGLDENAFLVEDETSMDDFEAMFKRDSLGRIFGALTEDEAKMIYLRFYTEMTYEDIGREMGISRSKVYNMIKGILKKIRKLIIKESIR